MNKVNTLAVAALLAGCASTTIPDRLNPSAGETMTMIVPAKGVQIYECRMSKSQPGAYEWAFVAPDAELFDTTGQRIGKHYAGPHWEAADGSKVVAKLVERADAPKATDIPWLLLGAKSVGGDGAFSKVTSIQRVNTVGGVAPKVGCSQGNAGTPVRVPYTADYYFFTPR
ncbi:MAG TPA: DUF3455 domain-containing protein [Burkholderiales bacterium]